jgi:hypothetical protein
MSTSRIFANRRSEKPDLVNLFNNGFWYLRDDWPNDHPGYVFLARAFDEIGTALHGDRWGLAEELKVPEEPPDDCEDDAVWDQFEEAEEQYDRACEQAELEFQKTRENAAREIARQCETGNLVSALRPLSGGALVDLGKHFWNTEIFLHRFVNCQMSLNDPFAVDYYFGDTSWIYLTRESLDRYLMGKTTISEGGPPVLQQSSAIVLAGSSSPKCKAREINLIGRPPDAGSFAKADEPLISEMHRLIEEGLATSPHSAAGQVADKARGGGTPASKQARLRRRYQRQYPRADR